MRPIETQLKGGSDFYSNFVTREVEGISVTLTQMTVTDADTGVFTEQLMIVADGELVLQKSLRIDANGNSDALLNYGAKLGGAGKMALQCSTQMQDGQMVVSSNGELDGKDLAPSEDMFEKRDGKVKQIIKLPKEGKPMRFDDGSDLPELEPDATVARAIATFAEQLDFPPVAMPRNACVAGCTVAALACAAACAGLTGPGFALCGKACVAAQAACIAYCAS